MLNPVVQGLASVLVGIVSVWPKTAAHFWMLPMQYSSKHLLALVKLSALSLMRLSVADYSVSAA